MADISLNELATPPSLDEFSLDLIAPITIFEFGEPNAPTETLARLFPNDLIQVVAFGYPQVFPAPYAAPVTFTVEARFGEAQNTTAPYSVAAPFTVEARFGEAQLTSAPYVVPTSFTVEARFGESNPGTEAAAPTAPTIDAISPAIPGPVSSGTTWRATLNGEIAETLIWVSYADLNVVEVIYDGEDFTPNFKPESTLTEVASDLFHLAVKRAGGWPSSPRFAVRLRTEQGGINV